MRTRRHAPKHDDEGGFTLIELTIVAGLMSLVGILVFSTVIGGVRTAARGEKRTDDVSAAQLAMRKVTADIRASASFQSASSTKLVMLTRSTGAATSTPNDVPERVTYELAAGLLTMKRETGTLSASGVWTPLAGTPAVATLAKGVLDAAAAGRPLFSLLSALDSQKQCATGATASSLGATVASADLARIFAVEIWLSINSSPNISPRPVTVPGGAVVARAGKLALDPANLTNAGIGTGCA